MDPRFLAAMASGMPLGARPALLCDAAQIDTSGITSGGAVSSWTDLSGYGNHLVQATAANQPVIATPVYSSTPVVRLVDTTDFMSAPDNAAFDCTKFTLFVVASRNTDAGASQAIVRKGTTTATNLEWALSVSSTDRLNVNASLNGTAASASFNLNAPAPTIDLDTMFLMQLTYDGVTVEGRLNDERNSAAMASLFNGTAAVNIGGTGASFMDFAFVAFFPDYLSLDLQARWRRYLARRYRLPVTK